MLTRSQQLPESGHFNDGDQLRLAVLKGVNQAVEAINLRLDEDSRRRDVQWQQDAREPIIWNVDGVPRSLAELVTMIIQESTQAPSR